MAKGFAAERMERKCEKGGFRMMRPFLLAVCIALAAIQARAAQPERVPVYVGETCESDPVGKRLAFLLREELTRSATLSATDDYAKSILQIGIVCLEPDAEEKGYISKYSYAITYINTKGHYDFQLTHGVGVCGSSRTQSCAESLIVDLSSAWRELTMIIREGKFIYR